MAEPNTIEREWLEFASHFPGMAENDECRRMFYSGAIAVVAMAFRIANESPTEARGLFAKLRREIDAYFLAAHRENDVNASRIIVPH